MPTIQRLTFDGVWEHTYLNPSDEANVEVTVRENLLNGNFTRVIYSRESGMWQPGQIVMFEGKAADQLEMSRANA